MLFSNSDFIRSCPNPPGPTQKNLEQWWNLPVVLGLPRAPQQRILVHGTSKAARGSLASINTVRVLIIQQQEWELAKTASMWEFLDTKAHLTCSKTTDNTFWTPIWHNVKTAFQKNNIIQSNVVVGWFGDVLQLQDMEGLSQLIKPILCATRKWKIKENVQFSVCDLK